ncbi:BCL2 associated agonist of cell death b [Chanos chanos]|uniref:BCL2 associated agonist of cell death b n=1 Tax=Chanos chanos TaxID=29144 RepID=A0A6J2VWF3_CHACN|nr:bcl2-associated agonist of cell death-like [Chanos chanos]
MADMLRIPNSGSDGSEENADKGEQASVDEGATEIRRRMHSLPLPPNMLTKQRLYSAPPALWAAKKCGRQLRRMSDEFDLMKDEEMKRDVKVGAANQMRPSRSFFAFLWSHLESHTETSYSFTHSDARGAH